MLHCLNSPGSCDMTVLERQRARLRWQQEQLQLPHEQQNGYYGRSDFTDVFSAARIQNLQVLMVGDDSVLGAIVNGEPGPGLESGWQEMGKLEFPIPGLGSAGLVDGNEFQMNNSAISRTSNSQAAVVTKPEMKGKEPVPSEKMSSAAGRESFKKRKADKMQSTKVVAEEEGKEKKLKACAEEGESKITNQSSTKNNSATIHRETSIDMSKETSKASEVQKPDYIHVRARRGQATDSHSLAERVRREKISERMKYLQDLVPGCNKITGKAGMLDEIINYVQSLQRQVEFLSMKLAAVNPRLDFNIDDLFAKEVFPACAANFPELGMPSELTNPAFLPFNPAHQMASFGGMEMGLSALDMGLCRSISGLPFSVPETFVDSSCFDQMQPSSTSIADFQNLYDVAFDQGRSAAFQPQLFTGSIEPSNLKMEM